MMYGKVYQFAEKRIEMRVNHFKGENSDERFEKDLLVFAGRSDIAFLYFIFILGRKCRICFER